MQLPGYQIIRKINQGGMSSVYLAKQHSIGREVALKIMSPMLAKEAVFSERFQREANIIGQLSHPNIIAVYDIGAHNGLNYIAMDYLPCGSLSDAMRHGVKRDHAVSILSQLASALHHAHQRGYIHRDIKPENILFRDEHSVVLTDFGVAKALDQNLGMTNAGTVLGTPYYMSPEQARGKPCDGRSDLYSLGVVFYEMLTGTLPFQAENAVAVAIKHLTAPVPLLPKQLRLYQALIEKLLSKEPDLRYQNGEELLADIGEFQQDSPLPSGSAPLRGSLSGAPSLQTGSTGAFDLALNKSKQVLRSIFNDNSISFLDKYHEQNGALAFSANSDAGVDQSVNDANSGNNHTTQVSLGDDQNQKQNKYDEQGANHAPQAEKHEASDVDTTQRLFTRSPKSIRQSNYIVAALAALLLISAYTLYSQSFTAINIAENHTADFGSADAQPPRTGAGKIGTTTAVAKISGLAHSKLLPSWVQKTPYVDPLAYPSSVTVPPRPHRSRVAPESDRQIITAKEQQSVAGLNTEIKSVIPESPKTLRYALRVNSSPKAERIRILNIKPRYRPGILLTAGNYLVELNRHGYKTLKRWVEIKGNAVSAKFTLAKAYAAGEVFNDKVSKFSSGPEMIVIPAGSFVMGSKQSANSLPLRTVAVIKPFAVSRFEVSFADFQLFLDSKSSFRQPPSDNKWGRGSRPVINVSWNDAKEYVRWLSNRTKEPYKLLSEAQWEYMAAAGSPGEHWWQGVANSKANCRRGCNSKFSGFFGSQTAPAGFYTPNPFGVFDTSGNVAEWVEDCYINHYFSAPLNTRPRNLEQCTQRVTRGGAHSQSISNIGLRIRSAQYAEFKSNDIGFRVAKTL